MSKLFTPIKLNHVQLKNRIVMSPMCMYSYTKQDGKITSFHETHYFSRAAGLITTGLQAEEILQNDHADLVLISRSPLRNPYWPKVAADELGEMFPTPKQYERGWG